MKNCFYIKRVREKKKNVLWPGKIEWFAGHLELQMTSKYIPISKDSLEDCHLKEERYVSLYCNNFPETKLYNGKGLMGVNGTQ